MTGDGDLVRIRRRSMCGYERKTGGPSEMPTLFPETSGATFSECGTYRYRLWREWSSHGTCNMLMLNPSTADCVDNDPTVERQQRRARQLGYGRLVVTNLFAFRATDPRDMKAAGEPVGPENDRHILEAAKEAGIVICAWGIHGAFLGRSKAVRTMLREAGVKLHRLEMTKGGEPGHPLYLAYQCLPEDWLERQWQDVATKGKK